MWSLWIWLLPHFVSFFSLSKHWLGVSEVGWDRGSISVTKYYCYKTLLVTSMWHLWGVAGGSGPGHHQPLAIRVPSLLDPWTPDRSSVRTHSSYCLHLFSISYPRYPSLSSILRLNVPCNINIHHTVPLLI